MNPALDRLARRVENDPFFLAALLKVYAESEGLNDEQLAAALACSIDVLTGLRLCCAPRTDANGFRADMTRIAEHFGLEEVRLIEVLRRGQSLQALSRAQAGTRGVLLAARDDEAPHTEERPEDKP